MCEDTGTVSRLTSAEIKERKKKKKQIEREHRDRLKQNGESINNREMPV